MERSVFLSDPGWFFFYAGLFVGVLVWSDPWSRLVSRLFLGLWEAPALFKLFTCPACFGFWFGLVGFLAAYPGQVFLLDALVTGSLTAIMAASAYRLLDWLLGG